MTGTCRSAGTWGHVNPRFQTPANAAVAVGVLAALPILVVGPVPAIYISIAATGLIYVAYFLCNVGVLVARGSAAGRTRRPGSTSAGGACSSTSWRSSGAA